MSLFEQKMQELAELKGELRQVQQKIRDLEQRIIDEHVPVKTGEVVEVNGYSHRGKKMVVTRISPRHSHKNFEYVARGQILKADGTQGVNVGEYSGVLEMNDAS